MKGVIGTLVIGLNDGVRETRVNSNAIGLLGWVVGKAILLDLYYNITSVR